MIALLYIYTLLGVVLSSGCDKNDLTEYSRRKMTAPKGKCIIKEVGDCVVTAGDMKCGSGFEVVTYFEGTCSSSTSARVCCIPCEKQVIMSEDCTASHCIHGRLSPGRHYQKDGCLYEASSWSTCNYHELQKDRKDLLVNDDPLCPKKNIIYKICKASEVEDVPVKNFPITESTPTKPTKPTTPPSQSRSDCRYVETRWSLCHRNNTRTRTRPIRKKFVDTTCPTTSFESRDCFTKSGKERCFYGKWGRWTECQEVGQAQYRRRKLMYGSSKDCGKTIKARICDQKTRPSRRRS